MPSPAAHNLLDAVDIATEGLDPHQEQTFRSRLLGVLAAQASESPETVAAWHEAITTASDW